MHFYLCENKHDVSSFRFDLPLTSIFLSVQKGGTRLQSGKKIGILQALEYSSGHCVKGCIFKILRTEFYV